MTERGEGIFCIYFYSTIVTIFTVYTLSGINQCTTTSALLQLQQTNTAEYFYQRQEKKERLSWFELDGVRSGLRQWDEKPIAEVDSR